MKPTPGLSRRRWMAAVGSIGVLASVPASAALLPTPRQTAGPFYPRELPLDSDNDLVRIDGHDGMARGVISNVHGQLLSTSGEPINGARIEIWQCDATGQYHHPADRLRSPRDENFQAFGQTVTDREGRYRFRTIRPVPYPGRTPHIHFRVLGPDFETLTTQLYIAGFEGNAEDGIFRRLGAAGQQAASAEFVPATDDSAAQEARFDIVVKREA